MHRQGSFSDDQWEIRIRLISGFFKDKGERRGGGTLEMGRDSEFPVDVR